MNNLYHTILSKCSLITFALASVSAFSQNYLGVQINTSNKKISATLKGKDYINEQYLFGVTSNQQFHKNTLGFGLIIGKHIASYKHFQHFMEFDYLYTNYEVIKKNIDMYSDPYEVIGSDNFLKNESISIHGKHKMGIFIGTNIEIYDKLQGVIGLKISAEQCTVKASHTTHVTQAVNPLNVTKKSLFVFGVEPTIGVKLALSEQFFCRLTTSYSLASRKKIISNYLGGRVPNSIGVKNDVYLRPSGLNIQASIHHLF